MAVVNDGVQRWTIDAPSSAQYEKDADGEWVEWDDVKALLWERDEARTEADQLLAQLVAADAAGVKSAQDTKAAESKLAAAREQVIELLAAMHDSVLCPLTWKPIIQKHLEALRAP